MTKKIGDIIPQVKNQGKEYKAKKAAEFKIDRELLDDRFLYHSKGLYKINDSNRDIIELILNYFLQIPDFDTKGLISNESSLNKGLLIHGDYGIGKSYLFDILHKIGHELITKRRCSDLWFKCISAGSFVEHYMSEVTKKDKNAYTNFDIRSFYKGKLYIDDLGFEKKAFNRDELFGEILFERNRFKSKTFVTTNLLPSQISDKYGDRIGDRLPEMFNIIKWSGESFRK